MPIPAINNTLKTAGGLVLATVITGLLTMWHDVNAYDSEVQAIVQPLVESQKAIIDSLDKNAEQTERNTQTFQLYVTGQRIDSMKNRKRNHPESWSDDDEKELKKLQKRYDKLEDVLWNSVQP